MKFYLVIIENRYNVVTAHLFPSKEEAIETAKRIAKNLCCLEGDYEEHDCGKGDGWLFHASYYTFKDSVRVVEAHLDKEI